MGSEMCIRDSVSREAGVSRGLLHYYFGTKERLLVEVVRSDTEHRVARLDEPLAAAGSVEDVIDVLVSNLLDTIENEPGVFALLFEVFSAGRRNEEIRREVADLFRRTRDHIAGILEGKEKEGIVSLRFGARPTVSYLVAIADGIALQALSDPEHDHSDVIEAGRVAAAALLST